jgi:hypothetical protein
VLGRSAPFALPLAAAWLLLGCGSAMGVPELDASRLHSHRMPAVVPPEVALEVIDDRQRGRDPEGKAAANVRDAMTVVLGRSGIAVKPDAPNRFKITILNMEAPPAGFSDDSCILVAGALRVARAMAQAQAQASGCYELRHLLGFSLGSDATTAYEAALNMMFDEITRQAGKLPQPTERQPAM